MTTEELKKHSELIISLSLDYQIGKVPLDHYLNVMGLIIKKMKNSELQTS